MKTPQPGDFEVVPMGGEPARLIRLGQYLNGDGFANFEHARLYLGEGRVLEAEPGGARIAMWDPHDSGLWSTDIIQLTADQRSLIIAAGVSYKGTPYSVMDYFAIAAHRFHLGLIVPGLRMYVRTSKHMICSQLVDRCYQDGGVQLFNDGRWNGYVTPADLANLLETKSRQV